MKSNLVSNSKKALAIILTAAMTLSSDFVAFADTASSSDVVFENAELRSFLIEKMQADKNWDSYLTQAELDEITYLDISPDTVGTGYIDAMHNFNDLQYLRNLETLNIDLENRTSGYIEKIKLPDTGKLKKLSIINCTTRYEELAVPAVEELIYSNNTGSIEGGGTENPTITITDNKGATESVVMSESYISKLYINNTSENEGKIRLDFYKCNALERVEFQGKGYKLKGDASFGECRNLSYLGKEVSEGIWRVDGDFDGNVAAFNVVNCENLGRNTTDFVVDYNFTGGQRLNVYVYGVTQLSSGQNDFTINREGSNKGEIYIFCDSASYFTDEYPEGKNGYHTSSGASEPNVAIFPNGNEVLKKADGNDKWVKQWDVVLRLGDTINNFSDSLSYYVQEFGSIRRVHYGGQAVFDIEDNSVVELNNVKHTLIAKKAGKTKIKAYLDEEHTKYLGEVDVFVRNIATEVELVNNNPEWGAGTTADPIYVVRGIGSLALSATTKYDGYDFLPTREGCGVDDVYWQIAEPDSSGSDGWKEMPSSYATFSGVSVSGNKWVGNTNTRSFKFSGAGDEYKVIALASANKTNNASDGELIQKDFYIKVVDQYNIGYDLVGGTNDAANPSVYTRVTPTINLKAAKKRGYDFAGWYAGESKVEKIEKGSTGNVELKAKWTPTNYTIVYDLEGGTNDSANPLKYTIETDTITLKPATRIGYTFSGWYAGENKVEKLENGSIGNVELKAKWTPIDYTITYDLEGGTNDSANPTGYVIETDTIALKPATRPGYIFAGWYAGESKVEKIEKGSIGNVELKAKWTPIDYTITYDLEGGTNDTANPTGYVIETDTIILQPATKPGYIFAGWYVGEKRVEKIEKGSIGNVELKAKWTPIDYTITYELNGGINDSDNPLKYSLETDTITLKPATKNGYDFAGWYAGEKRVEKIEKGSMGKIELEARWSYATTVLPVAEGISLSVLPKDADGNIIEVLLDNYELVTATGKKLVFAKAKNMPIVEGYTFKGWYQEGSNKKITSIPASKYSTLAEAKVNAVYVENTYSVQYKVIKPKGAKITGKVTKQASVKYSQSFNLPTDQITATIKANEKTGQPEKIYKLAGWTTIKNGTIAEYKAGQEVNKLAGKDKRDKKVVLYSVWE